MTRILGISAYYHDSAACLVQDGQIIAAAQEERFSRKKHDAAFPRAAVRYCLAEAGIGAGETVDAIAFYDKPLRKFDRLVETWLATAPTGFGQFVVGLPVWLRDKLWIEPDLHEQLERCHLKAARTLFLEHHFSHAASAFFPSPYPEAAILTLDGVGEWATSAVGVGQGNRVSLLQEIHFPHSLGLLYSAVTYFVGFKVNSGEYKLMGLAPYGQPRFRRQLESLIDLKADGSFRVDLSYFGYLDGLTMTSDKFDQLFEGRPRKPQERITQREMDLARSLQDLTEDIVLRMARHARQLTDKPDLCLAGGVALNCVVNGKLLRSKIFRDIWIQPAAGDAGGAIGAALAAWHHDFAGVRHADGRTDAMKGAYLGPEFADDAIEAWLQELGYPYVRWTEVDIASEIATLLASEQIVGVCHGRMEFGPRALGNRSILGDARSAKMQSLMNSKIKFRESFRPFAPAVLAERVADYFDIDRPSPYMLLVAEVVTERQVPHSGAGLNADLTRWVAAVRSDVPAVTHVDYSARVQTVHRDTNPRFWQILTEFERQTGCAVVVNTSFNVRGEPIVCTPEDAYRCFMGTEIDVLVLGSCILRRSDQPDWPQAQQWRATIDAD
ncbi:MAG: hypothetical protein EXR77_03675 [Myxococcales bacterium]|nr:hypothetical protein [Myxococcales bacterium]